MYKLVAAFDISLIGYVGIGISESCDHVISTFKQPWAMPIFIHASIFIILGELDIANRNYLLSADYATHILQYINSTHQTPTHRHTDSFTTPAVLHDGVTCHALKENKKICLKDLL